ncbi:MAG: hypothetical protein ACOX2F_12635 [bacterium]
MQKVKYEDIISVDKKLKSAGLNYVFIGGSVLQFLIEDPLASPVRTTFDIDIVLDVLTDPGQIQLEKKLSSAGFRHDISEGAPRCRWVTDDNIKVDILSTKEKFSGNNSKWLAETVSSPFLIKRDENVFKIASPACFIALKLEAFTDRGNDDFLGSKDLEDLIAVVDGRAEIVKEIFESNKLVAQFISEKLAQLLKNNEFIASIAGHLMPDPASQERRHIVFDRLKKMSKHDKKDDKI